LEKKEKIRRKKSSPIFKKGQLKGGKIKCPSQIKYVGDI
jgi:hypothetical protein